ncbi:transcription factor FapR [Virgibacillus alimentarius]|uniref:Transcription factor FapR n=1 Tax=Virgibacillus alimentarius TaxID=698769 RepID=A0ABS4S3W4_9BACI|nr:MULTISPECIES: transcription factor FapR [Virgibacillus]MBP2256161.1 acyl-coenzyme A thioesterase PaaI-like protein [Virgibacillus alimentarius]HLR66108.1 transcription factor FapR [Virgibacillus sp.]
MKRTKAERQQLLKDTIEQTPFITDEALAKKFSVSIQTIRLDRMELAIPELRERIKSVATDQWNETVKALPLEEVIGEIIDLELDKRAISILEVKPEHVFSRNKIARGHHLFAQANSLAVAVINDELALTAKSELKFTRQVKQGERVVAKATVEGTSEKGLTDVRVNSFVDNEKVFTGLFCMYRSTEQKGEIINENSD